MSKMKKMFALLMALSIAVSCFAVTAFAESESGSGTHNGYKYTYYGSLTTTSFSASMTSASSSSLRIGGTINYINKDGDPVSASIIGAGTKSASAVKPANAKTYKSATVTYSIGGTQVGRLVLSA